MANPTSGKDNLVGTDDDDNLLGLGGNDTITGGFGNDWLSGNDGDDRLIGGANDDRIDGDAGLDRLEGGGGSDRLTGGLGADTVLGGEGDDIVYVTSLADAAGDRIDGGTGIDTAYLNFNEATSGLTLTALAPSKSTSFAGMTLTGIERYVVFGGSGGDTLTGSLYSDAFYGGGGGDTLSGGGGADRLYGSDGRDVLKGDAGNDQIDGGFNDDDIQGGDGNDVLTGGDGNDRVDGGTGNDTVSIAFFYSNTGREKDTLIGGAGEDTLSLSYLDHTAGETIDFGNGTLTLAGGTTVSGFERLQFYGSEGRDKVIGGALSDYLNGGAGNDTLYGRGGGDVLADSDGSDALYGEGGNDTFLMQNGTSTGWPGRAANVTDYVNGGSGTDTVVFTATGSATAQSVSLDLTDQTKNGGFIKGDTYRDIEHFVGTHLDDVMRGDQTDNIFDGDASDDVLSGGGGNDTLIGGAGSDTLTGGAGNDVFDFAEHVSYAVADTPGSVFFDADAARGDVITDFTSGQDKLRFDLDALLQGGTGPVTIENGVGSEAKAGGPVLHFDTQARELWFDLDGKGSDFDAVQLATIGTLAQLKTTDVLFV